MTREMIKRNLKIYKRQELSGSDFPGFRRAAVLVPIFPTTEGLSVLLTVRTEAVETHKGQISLPGGMMDAGDTDIVETALLESCEEIGLNAERVEILGLLDDTIVPSKFIITPVVGYLKSRPSARARTSEVAEVFDIPLAFFADDKNARAEERELGGRKFPLWFYNYNGKIIWGATAGILRNLVKLLSSSV